ncbi:hypothetical protein F8388_009657 [Cannabis sativa]|uniref:FAS1 domain-containing protein n=1 Tax=Cannabis sativa TaxID=3483 RepID=A0A7J6HAP1_CANSA|nr:hypothetical protein F8388_009657 [Cannabis sativa]KAF4392376.1 hypothetical protein G4B88_005335 [Cannabis sativa]
MKKQGLISLSIISIFFSIALAQSPTQAPTQTLTQAPITSPTPSEAPLVQPPALANPTNATEILEKVGGFSVFVHLLKTASENIQIENQLKYISNSLTILAPSNKAFSNLKPNTLNSLTTKEKLQLIQNHIIPSFIPIQNFQTLINPVRTQANYSLNILVEGSWVNISTGVVNATINATIYEDNQLAIYKVDKVLLPLRIFGVKPRKKAVGAPAPAPISSMVVKPDEFPTSSLIAPALAALLKDASAVSGALCLSGNGILSFGIAVVYVVLLSLF